MNVQVVTLKDTLSWSLQWFCGHNTKNAGKKTKINKLGVYKIKKFLHRKGNRQQNKK